MNSDICRLCAVESENVIFIFSEVSKQRSLQRKIKDCFAFEVVLSDTLPKSVCNSCCFKVDELYNFITLVQQTQKKFKQIAFQNQKQKKNEKNDCDKGDNLFGFGAESNTEEITSQTITTNSGEKNCHSNSFDCYLEEQESSNSNETFDHRKSASIENDDSSHIELPTESALDKDNNKCEGTVIKSSVYRRTIDKWPCVVCNQVLKSRGALRQHFIKDHKLPPSYCCYVCDKVYDKYYSFLGHMRIHRNKGRFTCVECGKEFPELKLLESHSLSHSTEKKLMCDECGRCFKRSNSLIVHKRNRHQTYSHKTKLSCHLCGKILSTRCNLDVHLKSHNGIKDFICDICGKCFTQKGNLQAHLLTHTDLKPLRCNQCGKSFRSSRHLSRHALTHNATKPHICIECGRRFRDMRGLNEHKRVHSDEFLYHCDLCEKKFKFKGVLVVHRRVHTGEKPYRCTNCYKQFSNWPNYNKHCKRKHHNNTTTTTQQDISGITMMHDSGAVLALEQNNILDGIQHSSANCSVSSSNDIINYPRVEESTGDVLFSSQSLTCYVQPNMVIANVECDITSKTTQ